MNLEGVRLGGVEINEQEAVDRLLGSRHLAFVGDPIQWIGIWIL